MITSLQKISWNARRNRLVVPVRHAELIGRNWSLYPLCTILGFEKMFVNFVRQSRLCKLPCDQHSRVDNRHHYVIDYLLLLLLAARNIA